MLDISDPTHPRRVGGNSAVTGYYGTIVVAGNHLFAPCNEGLTILDVFRPLRLESTQMVGTGAFSLRLDGPRDLVVQIQRSVDLVRWEDQQAVALSGEPTKVVDPDVAKTSRRFYRAVAR